MLKTEDMETFEDDELEVSGGQDFVEDEKVPQAPNEEKVEAQNSELNEDIKVVDEESKKEEIETIIEEKTEEEEKKASMQNAVIEKIKTFLSKIAEMQREASDEEELNGSSDSADKSGRPAFIPEYYDLPYRYNETVVRVLAQTPQKLFVYWDIADNDRKRYEETFGNDFYNNTYPVLLLYNQDKQYVREIEVNDFANSWYINIDDPKTKYIIQLGRKFRSANPSVDYNSLNAHNIVLKNDYLPYAESNMMEAPNDHVLLESLPDYISFRNVKTGQEMMVNIRELRTLFGANYDVKAFYDDHYKDELDDGRFDMTNPSSGELKGLRGLNSSTFK